MEATEPSESEPKKDDMAVREVIENGIQARNFVSWRVPNEPSPSKSDQPTRANRSAEKASRKSPIAASSPSVSLPVSGASSTPSATPAKSPSSFRSAASAYEATVSASPRAWRALFNNVHCAVEELYIFCEQEGSENLAQETFNLLLNNAKDFARLVERFEQQRSFDNHTKHSVSWEVRKPTSAANFSSSQGPDASSKPITSSKLRAAAAPFVPQMVSFAPNKGDASQSNQSSALSSDAARQSKDSMPNLPENQKAEADCVHAGVGKGTVENTYSAISEGIGSKSNALSTSASGAETKTSWKATVIGSVPTSLAPATTSTTFTLTRPRAVSTSSSNGVVPPPPGLGFSPRSAHHRLPVSTNNSANVPTATLSQSNSLIKEQEAALAAAELESVVRAEVTEASEHVWAKAEAWIEAEAAVEDAAWELLKHRSRTKRSKKSATEVGTVPPLRSAVTPGLFPDLLSTASSNSQAFHENFINFKSAPEFGVAVPADDISSKPVSVVVDVPAIVVAPISSVLNSPIASNRSHASSNAQSPVHSPYSASSGRALHEKLSSPERYPARNASPSEVKRRQEAKMMAAEMQRDSIVAERRQKAMVNANRVRLLGEREAQKHAQAERELEERMKDAEKRHAEYLKTIKGKAGNENAKVSEVMFINTLNSEGVVEELQHKLEEVEARILAASERRQIRLNGITVQQRKKNSKKAQQMSDLRLQLERQKMERWEKLQKRLEAVQTRRDARLAEFSRRSDYDSIRDDDTKSVPDSVRSDSCEYQLKFTPEEEAALNLGSAFEVEADGSSTAVSIAADTQLSSQEDMPIPSSPDTNQAEIISDKVDVGAQIDSSTDNVAIIIGLSYTAESVVSPASTIISSEPLLGRKKGKKSKSKVSQTDADSVLLAAAIAENVHSSSVFGAPTSRFKLPTVYDQYNEIMRLKSVINARKTISEMDSDDLLFSVEVVEAYASKSISQQKVELIFLAAVPTIIGGGATSKKVGQFKTHVIPNCWKLIFDYLSQLKPSTSGDYDIHKRILSLALLSVHPSIGFLSSVEAMSTALTSGALLNMTKSLAWLCAIATIRDFVLDSSLTFLMIDICILVALADRHAYQALADGSSMESVSDVWLEQFDALRVPIYSCFGLILRHEVQTDSQRRLQDACAWYAHRSTLFDNLLLNLCASKLDVSIDESSGHSAALASAELFTGLLTFLRVSARIGSEVLIDRMALLRCRKHIFPHGRELISSLKSIDAIGSITRCLYRVLRTVDEVSFEFLCQSTWGSSVASSVSAIHEKLRANLTLLALSGALLQMLITLSVIDIDILHECGESTRQNLLVCLWALFPGNPSSSSLGTGRGNPISRMPQQPPKGEIELERVSGQAITIFGYLILSYSMQPGNTSRQVTWLQPDIVRKLCNLPIKYFSDIRLRHMLFPIILLCISTSSTLIETVQSEMSWQSLVTYATTTLTDLRDLNDHITSVSSTVESTSSKVPITGKELTKLSHRVPLEVWSWIVDSIRHIS